MFCNTPIARLKDGKLYPLGNKSHILFLKSKPGVYTVNCCASCATILNFNDQALLDEIHQNVLESKRFLAAITGKADSQDPLDKPVAGFHVVETNESQRTRSLQLMVAAQKKE